jgi:hypothetical protein
VPAVPGPWGPPADRASGPPADRQAGAGVATGAGPVDDWIGDDEDEDDDGPFGGVKGPAPAPPAGAVPTNPWPGVAGAAGAAVAEPSPPGVGRPATVPAPPDRPPSPASYLSAVPPRAPAERVAERAPEPDHDDGRPAHDPPAGADRWTLPPDRPGPSGRSPAPSTAVAGETTGEVKPRSGSGAPAPAPQLFSRLHLPRRATIQLRRPRGRLTERVHPVRRVSSLIGVLVVVFMMGVLLAMGVGGAVLVIGLAIQHAINSKG